MSQHDAEPLLTPAEVARKYSVDPKTISRWAKAGKLSAIRTLGGHRRYRERQIAALIADEPGFEFGYDDTKNYGHYASAAAAEAGAPREHNRRMRDGVR